MQLEILQSFPQTGDFTREWNDLLLHSASHVPFLRYEYLKGWWQTLGGGEWKQGDLFMIVGHDSRGRLVGIAPFFFTQNRQDLPSLMLLGSIEISDYLDWIARPEDLPDFIDQTLHFLCSRQVPDWKALDLYNILEDSPTLPVLRETAGRLGLAYHQELLQHCPYIPLPDQWEVYLDRLDKKQRHEIRRKIRRAQEGSSQTRFYIVEDGSQLEGEMEALFRLMALDPEKEQFLTPAMRTQMLTMAGEAFREGWLQLAFFEVEGEKAAGYLNFDYANQVLVYNSGIDPRFRDLSPGWVLLSELIQWAIEHRRERFDFLRGNEDYKYRFGGIDRRIVRAAISR